MKIGDNRPVLIDNAQIANANMAYAFIFDLEYGTFGKEYVLEDGYVTEIHTKYSKVKGENDMLVTAEEIVGMTEKLKLISEAFGSLANKCDKADFALYGYYRRAEEEFKKAGVQVSVCIQYCPKGHYEEAVEVNDEENSVCDKDGD